MGNKGVAEKEMVWEKEEKKREVFEKNWNYQSLLWLFGGSFFL